MTEADLLSSLGNLGDNDINLPELSKQMRCGVGVVPFVGAGLSVPYGFPQWGEFIRELAKRARVVEQIEACLAALQYEEAAELLQQRLTSRFQNMMKHSFGDDVLHGKIFKGAVTWVPHITIGPVITTNFDRLLERVFDEAGCDFPTRVWHDKVDAITSSLATNGLMLLKLHGDWEFPSERVLTLSEYQKQYGTSTDSIDFELPIPRTLALMVARPMLFLGCSLQQDRTGRIIAALAARAPTTRHYAVLEYPGDDAYYKRADELARMNICPIWFPPKQYDKIEVILTYLADLLPDELRLVKKKLDTIPHPDTEFVGRTKEQNDLRSFILERRVVIVIGSPGKGKTRLTIEVARSLQAEFKGMWFVPLSQLSDLQNIPERIAGVMQLKLSPDADVLDTVAASLKKGQQLLILDNCETVIEQCGEIVHRLLHECPGAHIVLTSRVDLPPTALASGAAQIYEIPPLQLPPTTPNPSLIEIEHTDSVELFVHRVQRQAYTFRLNAENVDDVARLCTRLQGIPLAIELVAAQMQRDSLESVVKNVQQYLDYKGSVEREDGKVESTTLRRTIQLSYDLLRRERKGERLQLLFRQLSVFHRGCTAAAALEVCGEPGETGSDIQDLLVVLQRNSLAEQEDVAGERRYRYLDSIREFAWQELASKKEDKPVLVRHANWAAAFAERLSPELLGKEQARALARMTAEMDNVRAAFDWAFDLKVPDIALRIASAVWMMMEIKGLYREGREMLSKALEIAGDDKLAVLRSKALSGLSRLAYCKGDLETSDRCSQESLKLEINFGTDAGRAAALNDLGNVAASRGEHQTALELFGEALSIHRQEKNDRGVAVALYNCGYSALLLEQHERALQNLQESRQMFEAAGNQREAAFALDSLAELAQQIGHIENGLKYAEESLAIRKTLQDRAGMADSLRTKAGLLIGRADLPGAQDPKGDLADARKCLKENADIVVEIGDDRGQIGTLECLAWLNSVEGSFATTVKLYAVADEQAKKLKLPMRTIDRKVRDARLRQASDKLAPSVYASAWQEGRGLSMMETIGLELTGKKAVGVG